MTLLFFGELLPDPTLYGPLLPYTVVLFKLLVDPTLFGTQLLSLTQFGTLLPGPTLVIKLLLDPTLVGALLTDPLVCSARYYLSHGNRTGISTMHAVGFLHTR